MERATMNHRNLWSNIEARLDLGPVRWRERIEEFGQVRAVEDGRSRRWQGFPTGSGRSGQGGCGWCARTCGRRTCGS